MEFSIQEVVEAAGVTSRTLRHYDAIGLLPAHRTESGYRSYTSPDLVRLQRILLLRDMGLALAEIAEVLDGDTEDVQALTRHLEHLHQQRARLDRQIATVLRTISKLDNQEDLMPDEAFDGFDHTQYQDEVEQTWGKQAYADGDRWWRGLDDDDKRDFMDEHKQIADDWLAARDAGMDPDCEQVAGIAARHARWIQRGWGGKTPSAEALVGLAEMYVADERFAANYGGFEGACFVRDGLVAYARGQSGGQHAG